MYSQIYDDYIIVWYGLKDNVTMLVCGYTCVSMVEGGYISINSEVVFSDVPDLGKRLYYGCELYATFYG